MLTRWEGRLADTPFASAVASLAPREFTGARRFYNPFLPELDSIVIRNRSGYRAYLRWGRPAQWGDHPACAALIDAFEETIARRGGLVEQSGEPWVGDRFDIVKLPDIETRLDQEGGGLFPIRIERRALGGALRLPGDALEISASGMQLTTPELDTLAIYEADLPRDLSARLEQALGAAAWGGATRLSSASIDATMEIRIENPRGYVCVRRHDSRFLPAPYDRLAALIQELELRLGSRWDMRLVRREPLPPRAAR